MVATHHVDFVGRYSSCKSIFDGLQPSYPLFYQQVPSYHIQDSWSAIGGMNLFRGRYKV